MKKRRKDLKTQIMLFFTVFILCFTTVIDIVFFLFYNNFYFNNLQDSYTQLAIKNFESFEYKLNTYKNILYNISQSKNIQNLLRDNEKNCVDKSNELSSEITTLLNDTEIDLVIYTEDTSSVWVTPYVKSVGEVASSSWYILNKLQFRGVFFSKDFGTDYLSLIVPVIDTEQQLSKRIATIKLSLPITEFISVSDKYDVIITSHVGDIVYSTASAAPPEMQRLKPSSIMQYNIGRYSSTFCKQYMSGQMTLYYSFNQKNANISFWSTIIITILFTGVFFLLMLFCIIAYTKKFTLQIDFISDKIKRAGRGDFSTSKTKLSLSGELVYIDKTLNDMIEKLNTLINEKYISEIEKNTARIQALQMQINPHFLYNTLEIMNKIAFSKNPDEMYKINKICQNLGNMFRYNITSEENMYVHLYEEINCIQNYLEIQNIRYDNNLKVYTDIAPETNDCIIIKFILQPIVENAIKYGIRKNFCNCIFIESYTDGKNLYIEVQDDGSGMSEQELAEVVKNLESKDSTHIGLKNIHHRIRLAYGEAYGINIVSKKNIGTSVSVKLPVQNKER